ncbi:MAG: prevent-host-death family protein [Caulobacteraceae bacterium]|nr:prevent-host-death family protein [Caulobacteraceae bacterium]
MSTYSVADAKAGLRCLINRALAGEEVIITRHGKPVVELRPTTVPSPAATGSHDWFLSRRVKLAPGAPTSVELLNMIYDEPDL